jgi:hypothetical protein
MTATYPNLNLRYEIFPDGDGWCWRCVAAGGEILARALRPMTREGCSSKVAALRSTLAAPIVCLAE